MVKVNSFRVSKAALVNTGNYENVRVGLELEVTLEESDDYKAERTKALSQIDEFLRDEVDAVDQKQRRQASKAGRFGIM